MYCSAVLARVSAHPETYTNRSSCNTAVIGSVEELAASQRTRTLMREQFETNLFGPINIIKSALPAMRERKSGHIISLTGISKELAKA